MAISTLVLGVGGTGVLTLRALKQLYQKLAEESPPDCPKQVVPTSFLALDFDRSALEAGDPKRRFAELEESEFLYLNPRNIQDLLRNLDRADNGGLAWDRVLKWFPDRSHVQIPASEVEANGASQLRVLGRLGFFQNDEVIEAAVRRRLNELGSEVDRSRLSEEKRVILVSSVAGGTGAGMFVDLAYIARRQDGHPRIFTYLLLPEVFQDVDSGGRIFQNAYACLKELAYLKDQQIPFQADYYRIPPVDVRAGAEEPFARIYLCRGDGFSGADSIKSATLLMAESILAQLQRTLQEKTLAIVSNTLSTNAAEEQKRRRTHCFSTVSSLSIPLQPVASVQESVFQLMVEVVREPELLEGLMARDLSQMMGELNERIQGKGPLPALQNGGETAAVTDPDGSKAGPDDKQVRDLLQSWRAQIDRSAQTAKDQIVKEIQDRLQAASTAIQTRNPVKIKEAAAEIESLKPLIFADFNAENYEANLATLKTVKTFEGFDKVIRDQAQSQLLTADGVLGTQEAIRRKALYTKLSQLKKMLWIPFPEGDSKEMQKFRDEWSHRPERLAKAKRVVFFRRLRTEDLDPSITVRWSCEILRKALEEPTFQSHIAAILKARGSRVLTTAIDENLEAVSKNLRDAEGAWTDPSLETTVQKKTLQLPGRMRAVILEKLREQLPMLLDEARAVLRLEDDSSTRKKKLLGIIQKRVQASRELQGNHYVLELEPGAAEDRIREELVRCRQKVFERRTPNPQRKGIVLIMLPQGLLWPAGDRNALRRFLEASASQILASRAQIEDYEGSRIWIYYEDLFNPPEHIRNMDEYYRTYQTQKYKELFHIDRRMLDYQVFREINSSTSSIVVTCGNSGCRENISAHPRSQTLCPACGLPIRSRCGNESCTANDLDRNGHGQDKTCSSCGGFNQAAWWRCCKHGKVEVDIPIDKARCPRCIQEHLEDRVAWPTAKISVRADLMDRVACPRCEDLHVADASHEIFHVPKDLLRFYRDGVNGHDREPFLRLAERYRLPEKTRCPRCRTHLIPIHHNQSLRECPRRIQA